MLAAFQATDVGLIHIRSPCYPGSLELVRHCPANHSVLATTIKDLGQLAAGGAWPRNGPLVANARGRITPPTSTLLRFTCSARSPQDRVYASTLTLTRSMRARTGQINATVFSKPNPKGRPKATQPVPVQHCFGQQAAARKPLQKHMYSAAFVQEGRPPGNGACQVLYPNKRQKQNNYFPKILKLPTKVASSHHSFAAPQALHMMVYLHQDQLMNPKKLTIGSKL